MHTHYLYRRSKFVCKWCQWLSKRETGNLCPFCATHARRNVPALCSRTRTSSRVSSPSRRRRLQTRVPSPCISRLPTLLPPSCSVPCKQKFFSLSPARHPRSRYIGLSLFVHVRVCEWVHTLGYTHLGTHTRVCSCHQVRDTV